MSRGISHWIILSDPEEYPFERISKQRGKIVDWDVGLCLASNQTLAQMKPRDRVLFLSTGSNRGQWCIMGELQVYKAPYADTRQTEDPNSKYYLPDASPTYYKVPMKFARKFSRNIFWSEIESSSDVTLEGITTINQKPLIYSITEKHYRCLLFLQKKAPEEISNVVKVEEISTPIVLEEELSQKEQLGGGQYGQVFRAKFRHQTVAVKELFVNPSDLTEDELRRVKLEVDILRNTHCPHIIKFYGACITENKVAIITELVRKGELGKFVLDKNNDLDLFILLRMGRDIAVGMNWLHSSKPVQFLHRDLKPSNLLVDDNLRIKICDFGFCQVKDPQMKKLQSGGIVGTLLYMAPEILKNEDFSEKIDVYSFGLILWEIITRSPLFPQFGESDGQQLREFILSGGRPVIPNNCNSALRSLMERCWDAKPSGRPSFDQIVVELTEILMDICIEDPLGRDLWRKMELHGVTEIEWSIFRKMLKEEIKEAYDSQFEELSINPTEAEIASASDYQLNEFGSRGMSQQKRAEKEANRRYQSSDIFQLEFDLDKELECVEALIKDKNSGKVSLRDWGNFLRWFGPLIDDNGYPGFLFRVRRILSNEAFHGDISEVEANHKLKSPLDYLIRFSGTPGNFTISYVSAANTIVHRRIKYDNTMFKFSKQSFYSLQLLVGAFKKQKYFVNPVNSSKYRHIFHAVAGGGYLMDSTEAEFMKD